MATRFDKLAVRFEATILIAAINEWPCMAQIARGRAPGRVRARRRE
ncbi:hypothetical protein ACODT5_11460 [Streptomyces sp. 5.8]